MAAAPRTYECQAKLWRVPSALPGGLGTLAEFFEMLTWSQLGLHRKASGLLNIAGYYDLLLQGLDPGVAERFSAAEHRDLLLAESNAELLFERMTAYSAPTTGKWLDRECASRAMALHSPRRHAYTATTMSERADNWHDKEAIRETLYRYCRGIDRMDLPLTRACWHADGTAHYDGTFEGSADALLEHIWTVHATMESHSHQMTNLLIEVEAARAVSETYVTVALRTQPGKTGARDILTRGRYIDRWSCRDGCWAIDHRHYLTDWMTFLAVGSAATLPSAGRRDPSDVSYAAFAELHDHAS